MNSKQVATNFIVRQMLKEGFCRDDIMNDGIPVLVDEYGMTEAEADGYIQQSLYTEGKTYEGWN